MNIGVGICAVLAVLFVIMGILFAALKEKAAVLVSGFNSFSREEQERYDRARLSIDMRNDFFIWAAIMLAGGLLSYFVSPYLAIAAFVLWLVLFFREVHLDVHKAFEKYLLK